MHRSRPRRGDFVTTAPAPDRPVGAAPTIAYSAPVLPTHALTGTSKSPQAPTAQAPERSFAEILVAPAGGDMLALCAALEKDGAAAEDAADVGNGASGSGGAQAGMTMEEALLRAAESSTDLRVRLLVHTLTPVTITFGRQHALRVPFTHHATSCFTS